MDKLIIRREDMATNFFVEGVPVVVVGEATERGEDIILARGARRVTVPPTRPSAAEPIESPQSREATSLREKIHGDQNLETVFDILRMNLYEWPQGQRPIVVIDNKEYYITSVDKRYKSESIIRMQMTDSTEEDPELVFNIKDLQAYSEGPLLITKIENPGEENKVESKAASYWTFWHGGNPSLFQDYAGEATILINAINARGLP